MELGQTFVGKAKDRLDQVDSDLAIADVATLFGPYTKFVCRRKDDQASPSTRKLPNVSTTVHGTTGMHVRNLEKCD